MDDETLERALQSIEKSCFIRYVSLFTDFAIDDVAAVDKLKTLSGWFEAGCKIRVSHARRIVRSGDTRAAIENIAGSRLASEDIALARKWLFVESFRLAADN